MHAARSVLGSQGTNIWIRILLMDLETALQAVIARDVLGSAQQTCRTQCESSQLLPFQGHIGDSLRSEARQPIRSSIFRNGMAIDRKSQEAFEGCKAFKAAGQARSQASKHALRSSLGQETAGNPMPSGSIRLVLAHPAPSFKVPIWIVQGRRLQQQAFANNATMQIRHPVGWCFRWGSNIVQVMSNVGPSLTVEPVSATLCS